MVPMAKKVVRAMMPTCTVTMLFDKNVHKCVNTKMRTGNDVSIYSLIHSPTYWRIHGLTLTELIVVIVIISLFVFLAQVNLFGSLRKNTFRAQVQDLVSTIQMAAVAAAESNRRYELTIDPTQ